ncbi:SGNH/GDSL hydrolase family protein [Sutcliffiella cohnii]|uniref:SGNH/GDSL hydrolase family protein n=1 Tax=Sutcliffiella cohnii TaxID=33932 RepID=UPI002E233371|nr:SGNH/GDSL hydrolase family protein [Sutcliffiella cohnii]
MRNGIVLAVLLICLGSIVAGHFHWENKIASTGQEIQATNIASLNEQAPVKSQVEDQDEQNDDQGAQLAAEYANQLPSPLKEAVLQKVTSGEQVRFLIVGSKGLTGESAWPNILQEEMKKYYGDTFEFYIQEITEHTSSKVVEQQLHLLDEIVPDVVLLDPFVIEDNYGLVQMSRRFANINEMINGYKEQNEEVVMLIQPSMPLYGARNYPREIEALQKFAEQQSYLYLNHWTNWPHHNDVEFKQYVSDDTQHPNEVGNNAWAEYLLRFFTGDEIEDSID